MTFNSEAEFNLWLTKIQVDTPCCFHKKNGNDSLRRDSVHYYCSRSGVRYNPFVGERKRRLKVNGSSKVGYTCPAHMVMYRQGSDRVLVKYVEKHFCHANVYEQLGHLRISKTDRTWITDKLSVEVPLDVLLQGVLNEMDGTLKRCHIITKSDLINIERSLQVNRSSPCGDSLDAASAIHSMEGLDVYSPIILYKRQGTYDLDIYPHDVVVGAWEEDDFLFGLMDASQHHILQLYGNCESSVVCVDSTRTTNPKQTCFGTNMKLTYKQFHLTTLMVLDGSRQGVPVAFLYSNRQTEATFTLFLEAVRERVGVISCNAFMSDITPQFYNSWKYVMGDCCHHLYLTWSVDKSFRELTRRHIKCDDEQLPVTVYRQLRNLLGEGDVRAFEEALSVQLEQLLDNQDTANFAKFFELHYVKCVESWAYCYRARYSVQSDSSLERLHDIFRHVYDQGKKEGRLDSAVASLVTGLCNVNYLNRLTDLRTRHEESLLMVEVIVAETLVDEEWMVVENNEVFTVRRRAAAALPPLQEEEERCRCALQCSECDACIDTYVCTCADSCVYLNMCKHIHCTSMSTNSRLVNSGLSGSNEHTRFTVEQFDDESVVNREVEEELCEEGDKVTWLGPDSNHWGASDLTHPPHSVADCVGAEGDIFNNFLDVSNVVNEEYHSEDSGGHPEGPSPSCTSLPSSSMTHPGSSSSSSMNHLGSSSSSMTHPGSCSSSMNHLGSSSSSMSHPGSSSSSSMNHLGSSSSSTTHPGSCSSSYSSSDPPSANCCESGGETAAQLLCSEVAQLIDSVCNKEEMMKSIIETLRRAVKPTLTR